MSNAEANGVHHDNADADPFVWALIQQVYAWPISGEAKVAVLESASQTLSTMMDLHTNLGATGDYLCTPVSLVRVKD